MGDYKVVKSTSISTLRREICLSMKSGWMCQGGVSVLYDSGSAFRDSSRWFYQAMVKEN